MCNHFWKKFNDFSVCNKCGLTILYNGKIIFDRQAPNFFKEKKIAEKGVKK